VEFKIFAYKNPCPLIPDSLNSMSRDKYYLIFMQITCSNLASITEMLSELFKILLNTLIAGIYFHSDRTNY
jgi:hypothetical protein